MPVQAVSLFRRLAVVTAVFAYLQIALGGVVRVSGSGLGCPDWPLCHGRPYPPADLHAIIEYSHRTVGTITGVLIIATVAAAWLLFRTRRPVVAWLATASLVAIAGEGALGGVVVAQELTPWLVATAVMSMEESPGVADSRFRKLAAWSAFGTYVLLLTGSTVVASGADEGCHSWPLCGGGFMPNFSGANAFTMLHRGAVLIIGALLIYVLIMAVTRWGSIRGVSLVALATLAIFGVQVLVGAGAALTDGALAGGLHVALATLVWAGALTTALLMLQRADVTAASARLRVERTTS